MSDPDPDFDDETGHVDEQGVMEVANFPRQK
jgi:hypothetical protein